MVVKVYDQAFMRDNSKKADVEFSWRMAVLGRKYDDMTKKQLAVEYYRERAYILRQTENRKKNNE